MEQVLKGMINITNNIELVREFIFNAPNIKVLCLDEEGSLPLNHPNVLGAICLIPQM